MARITKEERDIIEDFLFLPMTLKILQRDYELIQSGHFKLKKPYTEMLERAISLLQKDLFQIRQKMMRAKFKVVKLEADEDFTLYMFICKGYEEKHNYFNMKIKQVVQQHVSHYLYTASISLANQSSSANQNTANGSKSSVSESEISL